MSDETIRQNEREDDVSECSGCAGCNHKWFGCRMCGTAPDEEVARLRAFLAEREAEIAEYEALHAAVVYAVQQGCFFPVPEPSPSASVLELRQWGAIRHLHDVVAKLRAARGAPKGL